MLSSMLIATFLLTGADPEPDSIPKGPAPKLMAVKGGGETMMVTETVQVPVTVSKKMIVEEGGKKVEKVVTETIMVAQMRSMMISFKGAKGRTAGGKKLDADEVVKLLARPQVIAVSADGKPIDPAYLRLLKSDTLVVELAAVAAGGVGGGAIVPPIAPVPAPIIIKD
jgi:hypothetical protein